MHKRKRSKRKKKGGGEKFKGEKVCPVVEKKKPIFGPGTGQQ
jgi:hypothetical protein